MTAESQHGSRIVQPRQAIDLTEAECWTLLRSVSVGRVVFTHHAMPAIRPVNHLIDGHKVIVRTHMGAAIASRATSRGANDSATTDNAAPGSVVCYEADNLDPDRHTGWSVIVTGLARLVTDPAAIARYTEQLEPWVAGSMDHVLSIDARFISGVRLVGWCA